MFTVEELLMKLPPNQVAMFTAEEAPSCVSYLEKYRNRQNVM